MTFRLRATIVATIMTSATIAQTTAYKTKLLDHEPQIESIIRQMTLEEKSDMLHGKNMFSSAGPFEMAVREADAWGLMAAYNKVGGLWCSDNRQLLTTILRQQWGFPGMVISDWGGVHSVSAATAGMSAKRSVYLSA